jgi:hypothetical protein
MIWADGSVFEGIWHNDERFKGRMVMSNGFIYKGSFHNDQFHGDDGELLMPNMLIYKGKFTNGKTNTVGMIMY